MTWTYTIGGIEPQDDSVTAKPAQAGQRLKWDLETTKRIVIEAEATDGAAKVSLLMVVDFRAKVTTLTVRGTHPDVMNVYASIAKQFAFIGGPDAIEEAFLLTSAPNGQVVTAATKDPARTAGLFHRLRERKAFT